MPVVANPAPRYPPHPTPARPGLRPHSPLFVTIYARLRVMRLAGSGSVCSPSLASLASLATAIRCV